MVIAPGTGLSCSDGAFHQPQNDGRRQGICPARSKLIGRSPTQATHEHRNHHHHLNEGFFSRRNWLDWLFAVLVTVGGLYAFQRYSAYMDVYEKAS